MKKDLKIMRRWLKNLWKKPKKATTLAFWEKNFMVLIDGVPIAHTDNKWHHFTIVANAEKGLDNELSLKITEEK
jgi:hypothetical protein